MPPPAFDLSPLGGEAGLEELVDAVLGAGETALRMARTGSRNRVQHKADESPVTEADQAVERQLREALRKGYPTASILGEEEGFQPSTGPLRFIIDPIDGTRAFIRGLPTWSVLLAAEWNGELIAGIAFMPEAADLVVAARGHGCTVNGRPAELSSVAVLEKSCVAHGALGQFADAGVLEMLPALATKTHSQRGLADFANYRELLLGRVDAVVDPDLKAWDIAPVIVMVQEAGGRVTTVAGKDTLQPGTWLASNGPLHPACMACLNGG